MKNLLFNSFLLCAVLFTYTLQAQPCELQAPAVNICTDSSTGETLVTTDEIDISAPFITEYIITDDAAGTQTGVPNSIISIGTMEDAQAAIDASVMGESICITTIVHNTEHLDQIRQDLDFCTNNLFSTVILPLSPPLQSWQQLYDAIISANGGANPNLTIADIEIQLVGEANGGPTSGGTVLFDTLIPEFPMIFCGVSEYCYNIIVAENCVTIGNPDDIGVCPSTPGESCELQALAVNICTDSSTGETVVTNDEIDISAPFITEYIITDDAAGTQTGVPNSIISIGSMEDAQAAISAAAMGESFCITTIVHNTEHLDQIRQDLDVCLNDLFSFLYGITPPLLSWEQLYDGLISINNGNNPNITVIQIEALFAENPNGGPSPGGTVQILNEVDTPLPLPTSCDVSEYCYKIESNNCVAIGNTDDIEVCPTIPDGTCDIQAPTVSVCTDEATGEIVITNDEINLSAPFIIEYIVTDDDAGSQTGVPNSIIGIGSLEDAQDIIVAAGSPGSSLCITAIVYDAEQLEQIVDDIDNCVLTLGLAPLFTIPISSWEDIYEQLTINNSGNNPNQTWSELTAFLGLTGNGPGEGGIVDLGELIGLPPGVLTCPVAPYCYSLAPVTCVTVGSVCSPEPPEIVPTVSEWGLIMLGLLILIIGIVSIRQSEKVITH